MSATQEATLRLAGAQRGRTTDTVEQAASAYVADRRSYALRRRLVAADVLGLALTAVVVELVRVAEGYAVSDLGDLPLLVVGAIAWIALAAAHDLYHLHSRRVDQSVTEELGLVVRMTAVWAWALVLAAELLDLHSLSIKQIALAWITAAVLMLALRELVRVTARSSSWYIHRTLLVGSPERTQALAKVLARHPEYGLEVVGSVDLSHAALGRRTNRVPALLRHDELADLAADLGVHRVILSGAAGDEGGHRMHLARDLVERGLCVDLVPSWFEVLGTRLEVHELEGTSLLSVPYVRLTNTARLVKRTFDVLFAGALLVAALPLILLIAIAIKLDSPGPVLFRQRRVGLWGEPFELLKLRSMCAGADNRKSDVAELNLHGGKLEDGMFKARGDPRVTRAGAVLRKLSLDELPQLWNIVRGDMSVVGPRPLIETEAAQVSGHFRRRISLTPGLTGLWQVSGRSEIPFDAMVNLDYLYCTTWSLWGDIVILLRTVPVVLARRGAY